MTCGFGYDWAEPCTALRKKSKTCDCDCNWAKHCAALRKKGMTCVCDGDMIEPCAALRKKSVNSDCDWASPVLRCEKKKYVLRLKLRLGRFLRCAARANR